MNYDRPALAQDAFAALERRTNSRNREVGVTYCPDTRRNVPPEETVARVKTFAAAFGITRIANLTGLTARAFRSSWFVVPMLGPARCSTAKEWTSSLRKPPADGGGRDVARGKCLPRRFALIRRARRESFAGRCRRTAANAGNRIRRARADLLGQGAKPDGTARSGRRSRSSMPIRRSRTAGERDFR